MNEVILNIILVVSPQDSRFQSDLVRPL